jgi:hypothetical protein
MLYQRQLHFTALHDDGIPAEAIEYLSWQITSLQENQSKILSERGIGCCGDQCLR